MFDLAQSVLDRSSGDSASAIDDMFAGVSAGTYSNALALERSYGSSRDAADAFVSSLVGISSPSQASVGLSADQAPGKDLSRLVTGGVTTLVDGVDKGMQEVSDVSGEEVGPTLQF